MNQLFVDIHTHILPGVDDGSKNAETSLQMARIAVENGTKSLVCTKHTDMTERVSADDGHLIHYGVQWLRKELQQEGIPLEVLPGMEIMASENIRWKIRVHVRADRQESRALYIVLLLFRL